MRCGQRAAGHRRRSSTHRLRGGRLASLLRRPAPTPRRPRSEHLSATCPCGAPRLFRGARRPPGSRRQGDADALRWGAAGECEESGEEPETKAVYVKRGGRGRELGRAAPGCYTDLAGGVAERFIAPVLKTGVRGDSHRGFESHPLRHLQGKRAYVRRVARQSEPWPRAISCHLVPRATDVARPGSPVGRAACAQRWG